MCLNKIVRLPTIKNNHNNIRMIITDEIHLYSKYSFDIVKVLLSTLWVSNRTIRDFIRGENEERY